MPAVQDEEVKRIPISTAREPAGSAPSSDELSEIVYSWANNRISRDRAFELYRKMVLRARRESFLRAFVRHLLAHSASNEM